MRDHILEIYKDSNPILNDAYERLIAAIYVNKVKSGHKSYAISGCDTSVGNTTIAINIALSMALSGWKTILIDCDMKKSHTRKRLGEGLSKGLSDYLDGHLAFNELICHTNHPTMHYISCGGFVENPVRLLCSERFEKLLSVVHENYDFIIFDSPSINASVDGSIIASKSSAVILTAAFNKTRVQQIKSAQRELKKLEAVLVGIIVNKVDRSEYKHYLKNYDLLKKVLIDKTDSLHLEMTDPFLDKTVIATNAKRQSN